LECGGLPPLYHGRVPTAERAIKRIFQAETQQ
jgi:hypothetical protein